MEQCTSFKLIRRGPPLTYWVWIKQPTSSKVVQLPCDHVMRFWLPIGCFINIQ